MSDPLLPSPRPVSSLAVAALFALFSLYGVATLRLYLPNRPPAPQNQVPDNLPRDLEWTWKATPAMRVAYLTGLTRKQAEQGLSYGWVDKREGVVQVPIDRAMELIVKEYGGDK
jgi:hypothetical protein